MENFNDFFVLSGTIGSAVSVVSLSVLPLVFERLRTNAASSLVLSVWAIDFALNNLLFAFIPALVSLIELSGHVLGTFEPRLFGIILLCLWGAIFLGLFLAITLLWFRRQSWLLLIMRAVVAMCCYETLSTVLTYTKRSDHTVIAVEYTFDSLVGAMSVIIYGIYSVLLLSKQPPKSKKDP